MALGFWSDREYHLDRMNLKELTVAYFQYYAIAAYIVVAIVSIAVAAIGYQEGGIAMVNMAGAVIIPFFMYPVIWYVLHRYVLHSKYMWKSKLTAPVWKRIHYDHHVDPNNLKVLFGALYTTLPTVAIATMPVGYALAGVPGAAAALAMGVLQTMAYEYFHCIEHLGYAPKWGWVKAMKKSHMEHHFHNENGNYGITNFFWDKVLGTYYAGPKEMPRSKTVFNLGYTEEVAKDYPYVAEMTENWPPPANPVRLKKEAQA